ncbi:putative DNA-binding protein [Actinoplanes sp. SE50/110]|uniref:helix-turn-helix transcriptional regulator n=1 Tax=unclassified Actinoplanes TaxID=2626549 RepID=UPI000309B7E7|nr:MULTISPECIES: helix-turn-helix transcriptional regulator [unclassified Actinoplanes]AEV85281.2 putative DNA-binding protein [Actinoplanes sp. SE50/110]SLM01084.1 XRE family transcriptional regulator [Actinoplanes sp. SE50/110]
MNGEAEIGAFLRARRAAIKPQDVGLPALGRRRVPGLRREELAQLAGVSPDYYIRLEQGRGRNVSDAVLDAVARVLGLDETERRHLHRLARPAIAPVRRQRVRPGVRLLLDMMETVPAFILGRRMDVLAWNALGDAVNGFSSWPADRRNVARQAFLDPAARTFYPQWTEVAAETVAFLQLDAGRHPGDPLLAAMVDELSGASPEFARLWADRRVKEKASGTKVLRHPTVGEMALGYETLTLPGETDQMLVTYTAPIGSPAHDALRLLTSWNAPTRAVA